MVYAESANQINDAQKFDIDIPALNAAEALNVLAEQTNAVLLFPYKDASGRQANSIRGRYALMSALAVLLEGSGLGSGLSKDGAIKISTVESARRNKRNEERNTMKKSKLSVGILAAIGVFFGGGHVTHAQEVSQSTAITEEVVVTGVRSSIINAMNQKREAAGFVDSVSAEDLGKFPDLNISESLQRIPGVTLFRNNTGDGQSVNLRGLGSEFTRVEINGLTGTNNGSSGRFGGNAFGVGGGFNFEILASELFDNVSVSKSATAHQSEGGLAGLIQLTTPHAFDRPGFNLSVSAQSQTSETAENTSPRTAIVLSQNWNDRFGISASIAHSEASFKSDSNGGISARPLEAPATATLEASATAEQLAALLPQTINYQVDVEDRETTGITAGLQFRPSDQVELTIDSIFANIKSDRFFTRADAPPESNLTGITNDIIQNGVFQQATITDVQQRIAANDLSGEEDFVQVSAKVEFTPNDNWTITPLVGYSKREISRAGQLLSFANGDRSTGRLTREDVTFNVNGSFIEFSTPGTDYSANSNADEFFLNVFLIRPSEDSDEEISTKVDFSRSFDEGALANVDFGLRYSNREIDRDSFEVRIDDISGADLTTLPTLADALVVNSFDIDGAPASFPNTIITADPRRIIDLYAPNGIDFSRFAAREGAVANVDILGQTLPGSRLRDLQPRAANRTFSGEEETLAFYAEATFELEDLLVNTGVRYVDTTQTSNGFSVNSSLGVSERISVENEYKKFLPSITARYNVSEDLVARAAYSTSLSRPTLFDSRISETYSGIDESGGTGSRGNPDLQPFTSQNLDLGVEWYFSDEGLLAMNLFHKTVDGLIVGGVTTADRTFLSQVTSSEVTAPITFNVPVNGEETSINGLEFLVQSAFTSLPGKLANFGGIFNYTYANSDAAFDDNGIPTGTVLSGLSGNSYNAILYYDDGEKFDARLSYAWRERFLETNSGSFGVPVFQNDYGQLDFSANYDLTDNFTLQFQVLNLGKERLEVESIAGLPHTTTQLDRRWFFGARYKF